MTVPVYTDFSGFQALRRMASSQAPGVRQKALRQVAGQFEALFLQMMLKSMRATTIDDSVFNSRQVRFYQGMFDQQLALNLAQGKGMGLADMIVRQLGHGGMLAGKAQGAAVAPAQGRPARRPAAAGTPRTTAGTTAPAPAGVVEQGDPPAALPTSPADFISALLPHARRAAAALGTDPGILLAQAALETGWGRHLQTRAGRPAYNLFGIKAGGDWQGPDSRAVTLEYRDGRLRREQARFRAYPSPAAAFADYVHFIRDDPRYADALAGAARPETYVRALQRAGYATDPRYADKILRIWRQQVQPVLERLKAAPLVADSRPGKMDTAGGMAHGSRAETG